MNDFIRLIEDNQKISIFVHEYPDGDASSAMSALYLWLKDNFPTKEIFKVETDRLEINYDSLAIILDCATGDRVLNQNYSKCKTTLLIDHHHSTSGFTDYQICDESATACCEILADLLLKSAYSISKEVAQHLYTGIVSDSLNFTIPSTSFTTFNVAASLMEYGVDIQKTQNELFGLEEQEFAFINELRSRAKIEDGLLTIKISRELIDSFGVDLDFAKECIREFKNVRAAKIIVLFYESKPGLYNASIRSQQISIVKVAQAYNGGGHEFACGVKELDENQQNALIKDLKDLIPNQ